MPGELYFDEYFYAVDGCLYVHPGDSDLCVGSDKPLSREHPPLGKWLIAAGIRVFGFDPVGWRITAAIAGLATVALLYLLARRLSGSVLCAGTASGLLAVDLLPIAHSRIAMLDVFVTCFAVGAVFSSSCRSSPCCGPGNGRPGYGAVGLAAVPATVYVASFAGRLRGSLLAPPWQQDSWWHALLGRQVEMATIHVGLEGHSWVWETRRPGGWDCWRWSWCRCGDCAAAPEEGRFSGRTASRCSGSARRTFPG